MKQRGSLIVFEGLDRCGKTSQIQMLKDKFPQTENIVHYNFPNRTTVIGNILDSYLRCKSETEDHAIHLLFSANRWEMRNKIVQHLQEGTSVILDRYAYSGVAFTASKEGLDLEWCKSPDRGLPNPDLVLFLDISIEESMKRGEFGNERYEKKEIQEKVLEVYNKLKDDSNWKVVNAVQSRESLHEEISSLILAKISEKKDNEIGKLWC